MWGNGEKLRVMSGIPTLADFYKQRPASCRLSVNPFFHQERLSVKTSPIQVHTDQF
jgi:hypothetical protein